MRSVRLPRGADRPQSPSLSNRFAQIDALKDGLVEFEGIEMVSPRGGIEQIVPISALPIQT